VLESLQRRRSWLRCLLACFGEVIAARVTTRIPGRFVSGRFRQLMETVVPEKHAAGIAIHVPAALDPNWATEMPGQPIKSNARASRVTTTSVHGRAVREVAHRGCQLSPLR
jgi:hypothetical protein